MDKNIPQRDRIISSTPEALRERYLLEKDNSANIDYVKKSDLGSYLNQDDLPLSIESGGTGAVTSDSARTSLGMGKLLWTGSAGAGSTITVPNLSKYRLFIVELSASSGAFAFMGIKYDDIFTGLGGSPNPNDRDHNTIGIRGIINDENLTINRCNWMVHLFGEAHYNVELNVNIGKIYGVV